MKTRREFIGGAAALAALSGCETLGMRSACAKKRWYKGNLHTHTFWSDGKAFPEEAVAWYKSRGYNFLGLSDHNMLQDDPDSWIAAVGDMESGFTPEWSKKPTRRYVFTAKQRYFDDYLTAFPDAKTRTGAGGRLEARLSTFDELSARFNEPGKFLLLPDVEATRSVEYADGRIHQLHMNYVNLPQLLPSYVAPGFKRSVRDIPLGAFLGSHAKETAELAKAMGRPHLFILNHPIWRWYDVGPESIIENPSVRFFEVCNNGSPFKSGEGLPDDGFDTDRLWDVANAFRMRRGQPLLYGIGTDDTHRYRGEPCEMLMPGNAWSLVRAESLDAASLIAAMNAGDFVTCEGLEPDDVSFDPSAGSLAVSAPAGLSVRTVRFIVTKRDFADKPVGTVTVRPEQHKDSMKFQRAINVYDEKIGKVVKTVRFRPGEPVRASYTLADDDLYVRARIEECGATLCTAALHPQGVHVAWTQPYANPSV
ncbi:MAG: hypothetical protein IKF72_00775 [Kiritimatiellae bacterium]|nr:hypothetical protein [Kiritimatiellia bacterium]